MVLTVHRVFFFFFNHPAPTEIYTLSLHDALPISHWRANEPWLPDRRRWLCSLGLVRAPGEQRSEPGQDAPTFPPLLRQCRKPTPPLRGTPPGARFPVRPRFSADASRFLPR